MACVVGKLEDVEGIDVPGIEVVVNGTFDMALVTGVPGFTGEAAAAAALAAAACVFFK